MIILFALDINFNSNKKNTRVSQRRYFENYLSKITYPMSEWYAKEYHIGDLLVICCGGEIRTRVLLLGETGL